MPPGDAGALQRAIAAIRADPVWAAAMASAGSLDVRRRFTRDALIAGVTAIVDRVAEGHGQ